MNLVFPRKICEINKQGVSKNHKNKYPPVYFEPGSRTMLRPIIERGGGHWGLWFCGFGPFLPRFFGV